MLTNTVSTESLHSYRFYTDSNGTISVAELYDIGHLLKADVSSLRSALVSRCADSLATAADAACVTELSADEAAAVRDSVCRTLYARLFTYVVSRINESIKVSLRTPAASSLLNSFPLQKSFKFLSSSFLI